MKGVQRPEGGLAVSGATVAAVAILLLIMVPLFESVKSIVVRLHTLFAVSH